MGLNYITSVLAALAAQNVHAAFQVQVNGRSTDCNFIYNANYYGSSTRTITDATMWRDQGGNKFNLYYRRDDASHATSGRCQTSVTGNIAGSGTFKAQIYIHSNVQSGTGVFTIAAIPEPFDVNNELDLIVVNVDQGVMKSGIPNHAVSFNIGDYDQRWIEIAMHKSGTSCSTSISSVGTGVNGENKLLEIIENNTCSLSSAGSKIVVNARARDGIDSGESFVSIRSVTWLGSNLNEDAFLQ